MDESADEISAQEENFLYVASSQIPNAGKGLYTAIDIFQEEIISVFKGEVLSDEEARARVQRCMDQYFIELLDGSILDSLHAPCMAKYANDANGSKYLAYSNNARIELNERDEVCIVACKDIQAHEEVFCSYGKGYWEKHGLN